MHRRLPRRDPNRAVPAAQVASRQPSPSRCSEKPGRRPMPWAGAFPRSRTPRRRKPTPAKAVVPAGSAGLAAAPEGILLRYNSDRREWERLTGPTPLSAGNRLLCLIPSRAAITIGKSQLVMVGESEIRVLPQSTDQAPAVELVQGRLLFRPEDIRLVESRAR